MADKKYQQHIDGTTRATLEPALVTKEIGYNADTTKKELIYKVSTGVYVHFPSEERLLINSTSSGSGANIINVSSETFNLLTAGSIQNVFQQIDTLLAGGVGGDNLSNTSVIFGIDEDNNSTTESFIWRNNGSNTLMKLWESGELVLGGEANQNKLTIIANTATENTRGLCIVNENNTFAGTSEITFNTVQDGTTSFRAMLVGSKYVSGTNTNAGLTANNRGRFDIYVQNNNTMIPVFRIGYNGSASLGTSQAGAQADKYDHTSFPDGSLDIQGRMLIKNGGSTGFDSVDSLMVRNSTSNPGITFYSESSPTGRSRIQSTNTSLIVNRLVTGTTDMQILGTSRLYIEADGDIGIGTTSPTAGCVHTLGKNLRVERTDDNLTTSLIGNDGSALYLNESYIQYDSGSQDFEINLPYHANLEYKLWVSGASQIYIMDYTSSLLQFNSFNDMRFGIDGSNLNTTNKFSWITNGSTTLMTLNEAGKLGIGIDTPDSLLHIYSSNAGAFTASASSLLTLESGDNSLIQFLAPSSGTSTGIDFSNNVTISKANDNKLKINSPEYIEITTTMQLPGNSGGIIFTSVDIFLNGPTRLIASTADKVPLRFGIGVAPTNALYMDDGDMYATTGGLFYRHSGTAYNLIKPTSFTIENTSGVANLYILPAASSTAGIMFKADERVSLIFNNADDYLTLANYDAGMAITTSYQLSIYGANGVSISTGGKVTLTSCYIDYNQPLAFGDGLTDGDYRTIRSGNNLVTQRRESSTWVTKLTVTPTPVVILPTFADVMANCTSTAHRTISILEADVFLIENTISSVKYDAIRVSSSGIIIGDGNSSGVPVTIQTGYNPLALSAINTMTLDANAIELTGTVDVVGTLDATSDISSEGAISATTGMYAGGVVYINGNESTDNSWRIGYDTGNTNLVIQKRVAGSWVTKQTIT